MNFAKLIKHLLTDDDNETFDTTRTLFCVSVFFALVLVGYSVFKLGQPFSIQDFGIGMGAITAAFGISKRMEGNP